MGWGKRKDMKRHEVVFGAMFDYAEAGKGMAGRLSRRFSFGGNLLIWPKYPEILLLFAKRQNWIKTDLIL